MALYDEDDKINYLAYATSNNQLVFPKKLYWANSSNSVQLVYIRQVKELHIVNPSFYNNFQSYISDITEIRLTSHMPNIADVVDNNIVNITHNNNSRFVKTYMWLTEDTNNTGKYIGYIGSPWYDDKNSKFYCHGEMTLCFRNLKVTSLQHFVSKIDTSNVTSMYTMFQQCSNLTSLDLSSFNTEKVTNMSYMFQLCSNLTSLDLSSFNTANVTNMQSMFESCVRLTSIISNTFDVISLTNSINMFRPCPSLVGGNGTTYSSSHINSEYARVDGENGLPGYFTSPDYIEITRPSFLVKFPNYVPDDSGDNLSALRYTNVIPNASEVVDNRIVEITAERSGARTFMWLKEDTINAGKYIGYIGCKKYTNNCTIYVSGSMSSCFRGIKLTNIQNIIDQLDTSKVTDMNHCFYNCRNLQVLDLSNWDTSNVTDMNNMFRFCNSLTSLDLSNFDTSNVTDMSSMFSQCYNLLSLDVSNFDTSSVTSMHSMFAGLGYVAGITSLDCSNFNTSNVTDMTYMFYYMTKVKKIICNTLDLTSLEADKDYWMFQYDNYLVGGNGTTLNVNYVDSTHARIDGENGLPGYFTDPATQAKITLMNSKNNGLKYLDYVTINSTYTIPTLESYTAVVTDNNGNNYSDGDTITITQNITLTFIWSANN